jgi:predicted short-subunit dehydrogenase-like oxidoreductase (DUF2520 family)
MAGAMARSGNAPVQIYARNRAAGEALAAMAECAWTDDPDAMASADLYVVAVSDHALGDVLAGIDVGDAVVAHTAGSVGFEPFPPHILNRAVIYTFQTFTKGRAIDFSRVPMLIEGSNATSSGVARRFAESLSGTVFEADGATRAWVHLAGVFACNFTNAMYGIGEQIVVRAGLDFDILKPLITETARKAADSRSPREVQTGPASRGDTQTMSRHIAMLADHPELRELYEAISERIKDEDKY